MREKKILVFLAISVIIITTFGAKIYSPIGPTILSLSGIIGNKVEMTEKVDAGYKASQVEYWQNFDQVIASASRKSHQIYILPIAFGIKLINNSFDIELVAVTLWEGFYIISSDKEFDSIRQLKGKEIFTPQGIGQTGDVLIKKFIKNENLEIEKDVKIKYLSPPEIVALIASDKIKYAILPEPFVTLALKRNSKFAISFNLNDLWEEIHSNRLIPITGVFTIKTNDEKEKEKIKAGLLMIKESIDYLNNNKQEAVENVLKLFPTMTTQILLESMERSNYNFLWAEDTEDEINMYLKTSLEVN